MKQKKLKLITVVLLLMFIGAGCQKDEIELADESIEISSYPGINIYKTKKDYRNKLALGLDSEGNVSETPLFGDNPANVKLNSDGNYVLIRRLFLKSGYICEDIDIDYAFTNITITEMVESFENYSSGYWSTDRYESRIIDRDPFTEFYHLDGIGKEEQIFTIGDINELIESGTLETVFKKLK